MFIHTRKLGNKKGRKWKENMSSSPWQFWYPIFYKILKKKNINRNFFKKIKNAIEPIEIIWILFKKKKKNLGANQNS